MTEYKATDLVQSAPRKVLNYGDTGTYKTRSLLTLPPSAFPVYVLDFDRGFWSIVNEFPKQLQNQIRVWIPKRLDSSGSPIAYESAKNKVEELYNDPTWKTIIVDSGTLLFDEIVSFGAAKGMTKSKTRISGVPIPTQNDYGTAHRLTINFLMVLVESERNIIVNCHESVIEDDRGAMKGGPAMAKRLSEIAPRRFDEILHSVVKGGEPQWETRGKGIFQSRTRSNLDETSVQDYSLIFKQPNSPLSS